MKRTQVALILAVAMVAGVAGGVVSNLFSNVSVVEAQRAQDGIRIAVLKLETAARESQMFKDKKENWETIQGQFVAENKRDQSALRQMQQEFNEEARREKVDQDDLAALQLEIKTMKEAIKVKREQQQQYLALLLESYQKEVLQVVIAEVKKYAKKEGYDVVLQDYELESSDDSGFLSRDEYLQTLMSKPVLYAPNLKNYKNKYVSDITESIIKRVKNLKAPNRPVQPDNNPEDTND